MRTGSDYLRSLNDGRQVFVEGECVKDVTGHRAFREAARSVARLYDIAPEPQLRERMTLRLAQDRGAGAARYRNFDFKRAIALVDAALNLPPLE